MQQFYEIKPLRRPEKLLREINVLREKIENLGPNQTIFSEGGDI